MFLFDIWEVWISGSALCPEELAMLRKKTVQGKETKYPGVHNQYQDQGEMDPRLLLKKL